MKTSMRINKLLVTTVTVSMLLAACGGGGGGSGTPTPTPTPTAPAAPVPNLSYGIKSLKFTWPAVPTATTYKLFENPDGISGYTQVGADFNATSKTHTITLYNRVNASYIISACNSVGCTDSAEIFLAAHLVPAIGYMKASNSDANDSFGQSVALSADGSTLAIGTPYEDSNSFVINGSTGNDTTGTDSGAVYVFVRSGSTWSQQAYIKASNGGSYDYFGSSVALSSNGKILAVGAPGESGNSNLTPSSGAVYVFARMGATWSQEAYVRAYNAQSYYYFGQTVALSSNGVTLVVGSPGEASLTSDPTNVDSFNVGAAYVFKRQMNILTNIYNWPQQAYIKASNPNYNDNFGSAISISGDGNTIAVGAWGEDSSIQSNQADSGATDSGAVYVFTQESSVWSQQAYLKASTIGEGDNFGWSVALTSDGKTLAVGAPYEDSNATGIDGIASSTTTDSGAVYIFKLDGFIISLPTLPPFWIQRVYIKTATSLQNYHFGDAVSFSGDGTTLAVGADGDDTAFTGINSDGISVIKSNAGAAYVFLNSGTSWSQQAYVKASNSGTSNYFGRAVALSADGNTLAIGAEGETSNATGVNGDQTNTGAASGAGAVYLY